ncbi:MAG: D-alanine--D-alanine ligase [Deltaproteobacteria bacterium]|nr:D-alanine--D-alanine ligase [Deltaproteobacteria bacterium]
MGGLSAEREVSLDSGKGVLAALLEQGYEAVAIDWAEGTDLVALLRESGAEVVWNALHGTDGEDGSVQGLLECLRVPYTGSGVLASALCMDKLMTKRTLRAEGLPTPAWAVIADHAAIELPAGMELPAVVKPAGEGSSVGVTIARTEAQFRAGVEVARLHHGPTMVEAFVDGAEVNVGILGQRVLGSVEIRPATEFYDYEAKYLRDDTQYLVPPDLDPAWVKAGEELAWRAHQILGCNGYSRIDLMFERDSGEPFVIEANTLPGMTSHSLLPKVAAGAGLSYSQLCALILELAQP